MNPVAVTERSVIDLVRRATARAASGVLAGIGDDCAVLDPAPGSRLLATTDLLIEDIHFRRRHATAQDIGWKALAVNVSDIASMGGRPRWALVALACPPSTSVEEVAAFYEGMLALATEHGIAVVGGDTSASRAGWVINVTLLGEAERPVLRSTARPGDVIAVTGPLGRSAAGFAVLERSAPPQGVPAEALADVMTAHRRPVPRTREGVWLGTAGGVTAMIDLSDGLATDLGHIGEESAVGARVDIERLPTNDATRRVAAALGVDPIAWATGGGEDYELLLTCDREALRRLTEGLELATGTRLHVVGEIQRAEHGLTLHDAAGRTAPLTGGFQHFERTRQDRRAR
jgi:thiamine-monophosphate kinase